MVLNEVSPFIPSTFPKDVDEITFNDLEEFKITGKLHSHQSEKTSTNEEKTEFFPKPVYTSCPNTKPGWYLVNIDEGKYIPLPCNLYSCPYCGRKKIQKLYRALVTYFGQYQYMRLMTITLSSRVAETPEKHYVLLKEIWRRLITEIRRTKSLTKHQNGVQYVKCVDLHKSGFIHFHILISAYLPWKTIQDILGRIAKEVCGVIGHVASVNFQGILNTRNAARYVCKYVSKTCDQIQIRIRRYTRSGRIALFKRHQSNGCWFIYISSDIPEFRASAILDVSPFTSNQIVVTSQASAP